MTRRPADPQFKIPFHPLCEDVPEMSDDEFRDLRKSIRDNGFLKEFPVVMHEGKILDGRHRYKASVLENVEPVFSDYTGPDPAAFVFASIQGRNLTESTRAQMAARLLLKQRGKPEAERLQHADVRKLYGVGESIVVEAVRIENHGIPELKKMIENGEIKVKQAAEIVRLTPKEQEKVVAEGPNSVVAKAAQIKKERKGGNPMTSPVIQRQSEKPVRKFDLTTEDLLRDIRSLSARLTRYIQTSDGKRFREYAAELVLPWVDYSGVKIEDKGEGAKKQNAAFVALKPLYRLIVAASRDRRFPLKQLRELMDKPEDGVLDEQQRPIEPEDDPTQLVTPESL